MCVQWHLRPLRGLMRIGREFLGGFAGFHGPRPVASCRCPLRGLMRCAMFVAWFVEGKWRARCVVCR